MSITMALYIRITIHNVLFRRKGKLPTKGAQAYSARGVG